jgi:hypothetical protein
MDMIVGQQETISHQDVESAMAYMVAPESVEVKFSNVRTGEALWPSLSGSLQRAGLDFLGIHWFAIQRGQQSDTILLAPLYGDKFQKVTRRWNRTNSGFRFDLDIKPTTASMAADFYMAASHQQTELVRVILRRMNAHVGGRATKTALPERR